MLMSELLDHSLELGINSLDLISSQVCTLLEIISDIRFRPPRRGGLAVCRASDSTGCLTWG